MIIPFLLGLFISFIIIFAAVRAALNPILEYIQELKGTASPSDIDLLFDLRDNYVIESSELSALVNYRNEKRSESVNSSKLKRVEPLLEKMKDLDIYDDETFEERLSAVKQFYGIRDCTENNIL